MNVQEWGVFQIDDDTRTMSQGGGGAPGVPPIQVQTPPPPPPARQKKPAPKNRAPKEGTRGAPKHGPGSARCSTTAPFPRAYTRAGEGGEGGRSSANRALGTEPEGLLHSGPRGAARRGNSSRTVNGFLLRPPWNAAAQPSGPAPGPAASPPSRRTAREGEKR